MAPKKGQGLGLIEDIFNSVEKLPVVGGLFGEMRKVYDESNTKFKDGIYNIVDDVEKEYASKSSEIRRREMKKRIGEYTDTIFESTRTELNKTPSRIAILAGDARRFVTDRDSFLAELFFNQLSPAQREKLLKPLVLKIAAEAVNEYYKRKREETPKSAKSKK